MASVTETPSPAARLRESLYDPLKDLPEDQSGPLTRRWWWAARKIGNIVFERNISTAKREVELDHFHRDRVHYVPSDWLDLWRVLRKKSIGKGDVFVDFGSGKGRILYQAARYPFGRVIGVEICESLNRIARANLDANAGKLACKQIDVVTIDAADYPIPADMTVAYFYHPFSGPTFKTVIDRIVESVNSHPRDLTVIYQCPAMEEYVLATGVFELVRTAKGKADDSGRIAVYEHHPD